MDIGSFKEPPTSEKPLPQGIGKNRVLLIIAVLCIALGVVVTVGWSRYGSSLSGWLKSHISLYEDACYFVPVKEFQVNLADAGGCRYLRMSIYFETGTKKTVQEVTNREPEIRSLIISILRSTTVSELEGEQGMEKLGKRILKKVNRRLDSGTLEEVYFDNFLIQ